MKLLILLALACDMSLADKITKPERFEPIEKCVTIFGTIVPASGSTDGLQHQDDGTARGWLKLDNTQEHFVNADGNRNFEQGNLPFNVVCVYEPTPASKSNCGTYRSSLVIPPVGSHVKLTGPHVTSIEHGIYEMMPVSAIDVLK